MNKIRILFLGLAFLLVTGLILYQTDGVKRSIASYKHKIGIPGYVSNIDLNGEGFSGRNPELRTVGYISADHIMDFYTAVGGEQVMINSLPIGGINSWAKQKCNEFSIIYRNSDGNLNGINLAATPDGYCIEIESNNE
jgi:hypothetical protein